MLFRSKEKGLKVKIIRFFNTVGPRQFGNYGMVIPRFIKAALKNEPIQIYGSGNQTRCFCHVKDAVRAVLQIIDSEKTVGEVFNVGGNFETSIIGLAEEVLRITKSSSVIEKIPYSQVYKSGFEDISRRVPDISKIKEWLGWEPELNLENIITDTIESINTQ